MKSVAVTGGIGAGKSMVCSIFKLLGIPVFEADHVGKKMMETDDSVKKEVISLFGKCAYLPDGTLHRKYLADFVFNDKIALSSLNSIVHPKVRTYYNEWMKSKNSAYVIQETAIVFESGIYNLFDKVITISAPVEKRIERIIKRDHLSRKKIIERMQNQLADEIKLTQSDFVVINDDKELIVPQVITIHSKLIG